MSFLKYIERLQMMDQLIRLESTGSPKDFAAKLGISESHLYHCLKELKDLGVPISYNGMKGTYCYREEIRLMVEVSITRLKDNEKTSISGGIQKKSDFFAPLLYNQSEPVYLVP